MLSGKTINKDFGGTRETAQGVKMLPCVLVRLYHQHKLESLRRNPNRRITCIILDHGHFDGGMFLMDD